MEEDELQKRLVECNKYFNKMVNLIPARFYFSNEEHVFHVKESLGKVPNHKVKNLSKKKKRKLNPDNFKTVTGIQEEIAEKEKREQDEMMEPQKVQVEDKLVSSDEETDDELKTPIQPISVEKINSSESIEELREKLQMKIKHLKSKRNLVTIGKKDKKVLRKLSQEKMKEKLEAIKNSKAEMQKLGHLKSSGGNKQQTDEQSAPPVLNNEGEVVFSKFEFTKSSDKKKKWMKKNQPRSNRDYTRLLMKAEMDVKKMNEMKEKDPEKAKEVEENRVWKKALMKAQGTKVKDDPELIKKTMKRQKKVKEKSTKRWKERIEQQEKVKKDKQDKRSKNIQSRKTQKQMKKVKRLQKKGKLLPGF